jgi:type VI secretion system protein ImpH
VAPSKRQSDPPLIDRLFREFYSFDFFKAVHLLEALLPEKSAIGRSLSPHEEVLRFSVKPGLAFPPSEISHMAHREEESPVEMEVAFMGLIGPSGILPHWYNELAVERSRRKDFAFVDFLNLFHHRLISLFYLAWKRNRFAETYQSGAEDELSRCLLCLIGMGTPGLVDRVGFAPESLLFYSGLLARPVASAFDIESAVSYFSGQSAEVVQFVSRMLPLAPEDQTRVGQANARLGMEALCGSFIWESQSKFQIRLGPMSFRDFQGFLPSGHMLDRIFSLVKLMVGLEFDFEIRPFLLREEVPPCVLGAEGPTPPLLGWSTWVKSPGVLPDEDPYVTFERQ